MKSTKKPSRIKSKPLTGEYKGGYIAIPIDNPDMLVDKIANKIANSLDWPEAGHWPAFQKAARAVLKDLGVPLKKVKK